jgi:hypothetical protein
MPCQSLLLDLIILLILGEEYKLWVTITHKMKSLQRLLARCCLVKILPG